MENVDICPNLFLASRPPEFPPYRILRFRANRDREAPLESCRSSLYAPRITNFIITALPLAHLPAYNEWPIPVQ